MSPTATAASVAREVTPELQLEIERFLYAEAAMLDRRDFPAWFELLADDLHYVMPAARNESGDGPHEFIPQKQAAFFDESKTSIRQRLKRLATGQAWAETPPSRTRHLVTNVMIEPAESEGEIRVESCFLVYRSRLERQVDLFAGSRRDLLRRTRRGCRWEIARRTIHLDQATLLANNLSMFF